MIAIQPCKGGFDKRWTEYCEKNNIGYKFVNCYANDIFEQLEDCSGLLWQFYQGSPIDVIMAKPLLFSLQHKGFKIFPDYNTSWHFDDKLAQKYLLEAIGAPLAHTWIFYRRDDAIDWAQTITFPKVFKLRGGAGSQNVRLIRTKNECLRLIHKAFSKGFPAYDPFESLKERIRLHRNNKVPFREIIEGVARFVIPPPFATSKGNDKGYFYVQEYYPADHDIRVVTVGARAFAIKRLNRKNDFRASGSGHILYDPELISKKCIELAFGISEKLKAQCLAYDFINNGMNPLLLEISYGFSPEGYEKCPGYWDNQLNWHEGKFNPYGWMVDSMINRNA